MQTKLSAGRICVALVLGLSIAGCGDGNPYTLYRASPLDANMRLHIATFDAADGENYNSENCRIASELFGKQPGVTVRYWCEKGRYRS